MTSLSKCSNYHNVSDSTQHNVTDKDQLLVSEETDIADVWNDMFKNFRKEANKNDGNFYKNASIELQGNLNFTYLSNQRKIR